MKLVKLTTVPVDSNGNLPTGYVSLGNGYYDCDPRVELPQGATVLATGASRYTDLPAADKPNVLRATVYRSKDGTSLRAKANAEVGGSLNSKVPATGNTSAKPAPAQKPEDVLAKARQYHVDGTADYKQVPMSEVRTGDVVEEDTIIPHRWLGE